MRIERLALGVGQALIFGVVVGCGAAETEGDPIGSKATAPGSLTESDSAETAVPIASLQLESGNVVDFYDFAGGVLVSETGAAYSPSAINAAGQSFDQITEIWKALAPDGPEVPQALVALQERMSNPSSDARAQNSRDTATERKANVDGLEAPQLELASGCSNGCCDYDWLSTFAQCQGGYDYSWFLYNYGYSYANINDIWYYTGMVCSAEGTSTYRVNIDGHGGVWSVPEATWRTYWWLAAFNTITCSGYCGENLRSSANTSTNQHLHTYCGQVRYD